MSSRRQPIVRQRPVSFGNPALGTYHGFVYTRQDTVESTRSVGNAAAPSSYSHHSQQQQQHRPRPVIVEGAIECRCVVAMVDVPPKQVPEGILNLARSHRSYIDHVRIVIAERDDSDSSRDDAKPAPSSQQPTLSPSSQRAKAKVDYNENNAEELTSTAMYTTTTTIPLSPNASAMENAASILADEHERAIVDQQRRIEPRLPKQQQQQIRQERTYLVLIELCDEEAADEIVRDLHQQPYTSLDETEVCSVYHVIAIKGVGGVSVMSPFFAPSTNMPTTTTTPILQASSSTSGDSEDEGTTTFSSNAIKVSTEDYNCAVCLEHMDLDARHTSKTGSADHDGTHQVSILTTVCNHSFHLDCLLQWQDSPCPVCRYDHSGLNEALSQCHVCGTTEHNYVCLICGVVSCGDGGISAASADGIATTTATASIAQGPRSSMCGTALTECRSDDTFDTSQTMHPHHRHRQSIMSASSHARAHYDETLHAYALNTETQHVWDFAGQGYVHRLLQNKDDGKLVEVHDPSNTTSQERSLSPGMTEAQEGEVVHRKLEGFASQYYTLLKSQLEQQRIYYEGRLEEIRHEYSSQSNRQQRVSTTDLITALKQERNQLQQRLLSVQTKCRKVEENVAFVKNLNDSLEANREPIRRQIEQAQQDRIETRNMLAECLPPLQEKVTRLMLQLENSSYYHPNRSDDDDENNSRKPAAR